MADQPEIEQDPGTRELKKAFLITNPLSIKTVLQKWRWHKDIPISIRGSTNICWINEWLCKRQWGTRKDKYLSLSKYTGYKKNKSYCLTCIKDWCQQQIVRYQIMEENKKNIHKLRMWKMWLITGEAEDTNRPFLLCVVAQEHENDHASWNHCKVILINKRKMTNILWLGKIFFKTIKLLWLAINV